MLACSSGAHAVVFLVLLLVGCAGRRHPPSHAAAMSVSCCIALLVVVLLLLAAAPVRADTLLADLCNGALGDGVCIALAAPLPAHAARAQRPTMSRR